MSTVRDLLSHKTGGVIGLPPEASALVAAQLMSDRGIGAIVVLGEGKAVGIFTERDVLRRVVAKQLSPAEVLLADVMSANPVTCTADTDLDTCAAIMTQRRIRHLPVTGEDGVVIGLVSIGDLVAKRVSDQEVAIVELNRYIFDVR